MKNFFKILVCAFFLFSLVSCKSMLMNKVGDMISGANKKGVPIESKSDEPGPMDVFMGESDLKIIQEVLPLLVKMYEIMALEAPSHQGIQIMAGQLNIMYGNLCVQFDADKMSDEKLFEQVAEYARAKSHYQKGRKYILDAFEKRWPGFAQKFMSIDAEQAKSSASFITKDDVNAAYWLAGSSLLNWSLDPLDVDAISSIAGPVAVLERAAELDPDYSNGAIWDALTQFYAAAPQDFGGSLERAEFCYKEALRASGGNSPGIYVTYAESFCKPAGNRAGYIDALQKALSIDPDAKADQKIMCVMNQQKAQYLLDNVDRYFIEW